MKTLRILIFSLLLLISVVPVVGGEETATDTTITQPEPNDCFDQIIVYYLHSNRRCATCKKLEAYSQEAIANGFKAQLADSSVVWKVVNFESEGNEHFAKDYSLYAQSLIVSRLRNDKEVGWVSLEKIWTLVGDEEKFTEYVQAEVRSFMEKIEDTNK